MQFHDTPEYHRLQKALTALRYQVPEKIIDDLSAKVYSALTVKFPTPNVTLDEQEMISNAEFIFSIAERRKKFASISENEIELWEEIEKSAKSIITKLTEKGTAYNEAIQQLSLYQDGEFRNSELSLSQKCIEYLQKLEIRSTVLIDTYKNDNDRLNKCLLNSTEDLQKALKRISLLEQEIYFLKGTVAKKWISKTVISIDWLKENVKSECEIRSMISNLLYYYIFEALPEGVRFFTQQDIDEQKTNSRYISWGMLLQNLEYVGDDELYIKPAKKKIPETTSEGPY